MDCHSVSSIYFFKNIFYKRLPFDNLLSEFGLPRCMLSQKHIPMSLAYMYDFVQLKPWLRPSMVVVFV